MKRKFVLITPTYNEALNIEATIKTVLHNFPKNTDDSYHILVVDGNSPDKTADIVRSFIPKHKNLHLLTEDKKGGLGAAYLQGMDYSFNKMNADYVFEFDADLSHDPKKIPEFIKKIDEGYDLVLGTRYRGGGSIPQNWGWHRKFLSVFGNLFIRLMFLSNKISDWTGGYKCISKKVYEKVRGKVSLQKGYTFQISLNKEALNSGFKIAEVPFGFKDRVKGDSKLGPEFLFNAFIFVIITQIKYFIKSSFFKVCLVGTVGFAVQTIFFTIFYNILNIDNALSVVLSAEIAITSNYILNNNFSFKSSKVKGIRKLAPSFIKFNLLSVGSILVQWAYQHFGTKIFGESTFVVYSLFVTGVLTGLMVNFFFYSTFIWKTKKLNTQ